jgi:hypothetical protein
MAKWEDAQLAAVEFNDGANRFCLDRIPNEDVNFDPALPYRFVWRGDSAGTNKLLIRPAHFDWGLLGETVRQALLNGRLTYEEFEPFIRTIFNIRR